MVASFHDKLGAVGQLVAHIKWSAVEELDSAGSQTDICSFYKVQHLAVFRGDNQYPEAADILMDYEGTETSKNAYAADRAQPAGTGVLTTRTVSSGSRRGDPSRRGHEDEDDDEEGGGGGEGPPRKRVRQEDSNSGPKKLLACPFFKHNPARYTNARSCVGPGWPSAHRVKFVLLKYCNC